jgi:hypothetical protein
VTVLASACPFQISFTNMCVFFLIPMMFLLRYFARGNICTIFVDVQIKVGAIANCKRNLTFYVRIRLFFYSDNTLLYHNWNFSPKNLIALGCKIQFEEKFPLIRENVRMFSPILLKRNSFLQCSGSGSKSGSGSTWVPLPFGFPYFL